MEMWGRGSARRHLGSRDRARAHTRARILDRKARHVILSRVSSSFRDVRPHRVAVNRSVGPFSKNVAIFRQTSTAE
jgi:hypothetical protein